MHHTDWIHVLVAAVAAFVAVVGGGLATKLGFHLVDRNKQVARSAESVEAAGATLRGGAWIGALERVAIFAGVLARWPEAIAIVLAVKGLGRYPELRSGEKSAVAERFIIGTFISVLWACGCAGLALWLMT